MSEKGIATLAIVVIVIVAVVAVGAGFILLASKLGQVAGPVVARARTNQVRSKFRSRYG